MNANSIKLSIQGIVVAFATLLLTSVGMANPQSGQVAQGTANISHDGGLTKIDQSSQRAVINWDSFNIGKDEHTQFVQPSSSAVTLNRVDGKNGASAIQGKMTANGKVFLVNPAGIVFGNTASVDVGGLLATTADITDSDLMNGKLKFQQSNDYPTSSVSNFGNITVKDGGLAMLVAPGVENAGIIKANLGTVDLASGLNFTIDLFGDSLINFAAEKGIDQQPLDSKGNKMKSAVRNSGQIIADGGSVSMTAQGAKNVVDNAINMDGYIQADTVNQQMGVVLLGSDDSSVIVSGEISAQGKNAQQAGGLVFIAGGLPEVPTSGQTKLTDSAKIDVSGQAGGGVVTIFANESNDIAPKAQVLANGTNNGNGGVILLMSEDKIGLAGHFEAKAGPNGGDGGLIGVISGGKTSYSSFSGSTTAPKGKKGLVSLQSNVGSLQ